MLMGYQIIEFWMLCAVNLFFPIKTHKNIRRLIVFFSSWCVDFWLWCEFFDPNIFLGAPLNLFEFVWWSQLFSQHGTSQRKYYWRVCVILWCTFCGGTHPGVFFNKCVQKTFGQFWKNSVGGCFLGHCCKLEGFFIKYINAATINTNKYQ